MFNTVVEGRTEVEMGIDIATWRARIGLNYCHQSRYACRPLPVQWRAARWGVGEVMNSTPLLLQGCMAVVSLSLILGYTFRMRPIRRCGCGKVCRPKLIDGSVPSAEVRGMADTGIIGVFVLLGVCAVVLALLLLAGDVERNPGPTGKEGIYNPVLGKMTRFRGSNLTSSKVFVTGIKTAKLVNDHLIAMSFHFAAFGSNDKI